MSKTFVDSFNVGVTYCSFSNSFHLNQSSPFGKSAADCWRVHATSIKTAIKDVALNILKVRRSTRCIISWHQPFVSRSATMLIRASWFHTSIQIGSILMSLVSHRLLGNYSSVNSGSSFTLYLIPEFPQFSRMTSHEVHSARLGKRDGKSSGNLPRRRTNSAGAILPRPRTLPFPRKRSRPLTCQPRRHEEFRQLPHFTRKKHWPDLQVIIPSRRTMNSNANPPTQHEFRDGALEGRSITLLPSPCCQRTLRLTQI